MSHTPGPWTMNRFDEVLKPDGRPVPVCGFASPLGNSPDIAEGKANGRLFFAAPDLKEALKAICDLCIDVHDAAGHPWDIFPEIKNTARAALAKCEPEVKA